MGTITLTVRDEVEEKFREMVGEAYPQKKGSLGRAVTEAMELWIQKRHQERASERGLALMKLDFDLGKRRYGGREELHG